MVAALRFVGGDEIVEPFLFETTDGDILDLTTVTISGGVWWRNQPRIPLALGSGIDIENDAPARAAVGEDQTPHGFITLTELQTVLLPYGQVSSIRLVAIRSLDGVTMSSYLAPLERIP